MRLNSWISRLAAFARSVRASYWSDLPHPSGSRPWRQRAELRPDPISLRRLEERRVLSATIQSLLLPAQAVEGETVEVSAEATGVGTLSFDWTLTRDTTVIVVGDSQDAAFQAPEEGLYTVSLTATDTSDNGAHTVQGSLEVLRREPQVGNLGITNTGEGRTAVLFGQVRYAQPGDELTLDIDWGDPLSPPLTERIDLSNPRAGATYDPSTGNFRIEHTYLDDNPSGTPRDVYDVTIDLRRSDRVVDSGAVQVEVINLRPTLTGLNARPIDEGGATVLSGAVRDIGPLDTFQLTIDWGDPLRPGNLQVIDLSAPPPGVAFDPGSGLFTVQHQYAEDSAGATYQIRVTATDDDGGAASGMTSVAVGNVAPRLTDLAATDTREGEATTLTGTIVDPGVEDPITLTVRWADGTQETFYYDPGTTEFSETHTYLDDNPTGTPSDLVTISLTVSDDDGGATNHETSLRIANVAPTIVGLSASSTRENEKTVLTGRIEDPGVNDTHRLSILWGDDPGGSPQVLNLFGPLPQGVSYDATTGEFAIEHRYLDDDPTGTRVDTFPIEVTVYDDDTGMGYAETAAEVANVAPTLAEVSATSVDEHGVATLSGRIVDPGSLDTFTLTVNWADGSVIDYTTTPGVPGVDLLNPPAGVTFDATTRAFTIEHQYLDDDPTGTDGDDVEIRLTLVDDDTDMAVDATTIRVNNVAPTLAGLTAAPINEHGETILTGTIVDAGTLDTHTLTINWGDPLSPVNNIQTIDLTQPLPPGVTYDASTREFSITHQYLDDNPSATPSDPYTISVTVTDDDTASSTATTVVTVSNLKPDVVDLAATAIPENGTTVLSGRIVDTGTLDTHTLTINWGDPLSPVNNIQTIDLTQPLPPRVTYDATTREFSIEHQYLDDNPTATLNDTYDITVTVKDDDGGERTRGTTVEVTNVAPVFGPARDVVIDEGGSVVIDSATNIDFIFVGEPPPTIALGFSDVGSLDTHIAEVDWGDGSPSEELPIGDGIGDYLGLAGSHTYADNGVYTVEVTVTDDDGGQDVAYFTVTVENVDPVLTGTTGHEVFEGDPVTLAGLGVGLSDPGFDNPLNTLDPSNGGETTETFTGVMIDWGDGSPADVVTVTDRVNGSAGNPTTASFSHATHYYADDGLYTVEVTLRDDDGGNVTRSFEILVKNVAPDLTLTSEMFIIDEGQVLFLPEWGHFTDPGADNPLNPALNGGPTQETHHYTVDWGDGHTDLLQMPVMVIDYGAGVGTEGALTSQHFYADNDSDGTRDNRYTITVTLHDDDGGMDQEQIEIVVYNVDPTILPLTEGELIDDEYMPGILADAQNLTGTGSTVLVFRFDDPGADTHQYWIDWGDQLDEPPGDNRYVQETPIAVATTPDGVLLAFEHQYLGPPDPTNPAADIVITAAVVDDDYTHATGGLFEAASTAAFLVEPGRSNAAMAVITNPGLDVDAVAIDTRPEVAAIEFPALEESPLPPPVQSSGAVVLQTQDAPTGGGGQTATTERVWELRSVTPDGRIGPATKLSPEQLDDLPSVFMQLKDGRYLILMLRSETGARRLVLDVYIRDGKPIDIGDDSDGGQDKPPTASDAELAPAADQINLDVQDAPRGAAVPPLPAGPPTGPPADSAGQRAGSLLAGGAAAAVLARRYATANYRDRVEDTLSQNSGLSWKAMAALRRRPR